MKGRAVAGTAGGLPRAQNVDDESASRKPADAELLSLMAAGDERALGELYDRFGGVAYGLALRIVRDPGFAEDVVQDAFLCVWRSASSFDVGRGTVRGWLLMLVHRRAVDLVKREERQREQRPDVVPATVGVSAAEAAALRSDRGRIQEALRTLPEVERQALELAYYGGLSQSQIARRLEVPLGTIKSRAFSGLRRLRTVLQDDEDQLASESAGSGG